MDVVEGSLDATGGRFALVASRFNRPITQQLVDGAFDCLRRHGAEALILYWVPGAFELPLLAQKLAESQQYDAVICLGAVIQGETPHFDFVAGQAASGIMQVSLKTGIPIIFSVLTTHTVEQAQQRAGVKGGNAGFQGALTAIEMAGLMQQLTLVEPCALKPHLAHETVH